MPVSRLCARSIEVILGIGEIRRDRALQLVVLQVPAKAHNEWRDNSRVAQAGQPGGGMAVHARGKPDLQNLKVFESSLRVPPHQLGGNVPFS